MVAYITHAVLSGGAVERVAASVLDELVVTDTIPLSEEAKQCPRIRQLSVASLLAETIRRIRDEPPDLLEIHLGRRRERWRCRAQQAP